jgi:uncharacterized protein
MSRDTTWLRYEAATRRCSLRLHIQPNAGKSEIVGLHGDALKIRIAAPATEDKANSELIEFLSKALGIAKSSIAIRHGAASRRKVVEVSGGADVAARLRGLL